MKPPAGTAAASHSRCSEITLVKAAGKGGAGEGGSAIGKGPLHIEEKPLESP